jgi:hypothetical protein
VAIISQVGDGEEEIVQQNTSSTRATYDLDMIDGKWRIDSKRVLGWLRSASDPALRRTHHNEAWPLSLRVHVALCRDLGLCDDPDGIGCAMA